MLTDSRPPKTDAASFSPDPFDRKSEKKHFWGQRENKKKQRRRFKIWSQVSFFSFGEGSKQDGWNGRVTSFRTTTARAACFCRDEKWCLWPFGVAWSLRFHLQTGFLTYDKVSCRPAMLHTQLQYWEISLKMVLIDFINSKWHREAMPLLRWIMNSPKYVLIRLACKLLVFIRCSSLGGGLWWVKVSGP